MIFYCIFISRGVKKLETFHRFINLSSSLSSSSWFLNHLTLSPASTACLFKLTEIYVRIKLKKGKILVLKIEDTSYILEINSLGSLTVVVTVLVSEGLTSSGSSLTSSFFSVFLGLGPFFSALSPLVSVFFLLFVNLVIFPESPFSVV